MAFEPTWEWGPTPESTLGATSTGAEWYGGPMTERVLAAVFRANHLHTIG